MGALGSLINVVVAGVVPLAVLKTNRLGQLVACELLMRSQNFAVSP